VFGDGEALTSDSIVRFRERRGRDQLVEHGYEVHDVRDAPDRPDRELGFLARRSQ
jgi:hypothetical protein